VTRSGFALAGSLAAALLLPATAGAQGVGQASWTPAGSETSALSSELLTPGDSITFQTDETWDRAQVSGLESYLGRGLRYTLELNDGAGRLSATGYWATNYPDPVFDRDDDDGDGRWEEAEIIAGAVAPEAGRTYTSLVQFSRWRGKRVKGVCDWAWDRRRGQVVILSQLSRSLLGEWQAQRYTLTYDQAAYPRVGPRPDLPDGVARPRCRDQRPGVSQEGFVVTFSRPLPWSELTGLISVGSGKWTAFEAVGSHGGDGLLWTCGGPVEDAVRLEACRRMGVRPDGISAAVGFFDDLALGQLREHQDVAAVETLQDTLTELLVGVSGLGLEPPGLAVNDRYWEIVLAD
jgi:hypothetical protein